jgi:transcriptional regulator with XRE-family HTH domain
MSPKGERTSAPDYAPIFFKALGRRVKELRKQAGYTQADMANFKFSIRHWQQIERGRPVTVTTLIRISEIFKIKLEDLLQGLLPEPSPPPPLPPDLR